jgi:hypothetical protein
MGGANFACPLIAVSDGDIIYAAERNAEFSNISANFNPAGMSGYQDTLAQKKLQEDPATGLVTSLAKDIEQLRFVINRIMGNTTWWYEAPSNDLANTLVQNNPTDVVLGDGTKTDGTPLLTLNADTGNAALRLQVDAQTTPKSWDIYVDNADGDALKISSSLANNEVQLSSAGLTVTRSGSNRVLINNSASGTGAAYLRLRNNGTNANAWDLVANSASPDYMIIQYGESERYRFAPGSNADRMSFDSVDPNASTSVNPNTLYPTVIPKSWGRIRIEHGVASPVSVMDGFNIASVALSNSNQNLDVTFVTEIENANYSVTLGDGLSSSSAYYSNFPKVLSQSTAGFSLAWYDADTDSITPWSILTIGVGQNTYINFQVLGRQNS